MLRLFKFWRTRPRKASLQVDRTLPLAPVDRPVTREDLWNDFEKRSNLYMYGPDRLSPNDQMMFHWVGSISYNGFEREKSLRYLIHHFTPGNENRILLRLVDWVPQVQTIAEKWVLENYQYFSIETVRQNEHLFLYLFRKEMLKNSEVINRLKAHIWGLVAELTALEFWQFHPRFRRFIYMELADEASFLKVMMVTDPDPTNRQFIFNRFELSDLTPDECLKIKEDRSLAVKKAYYYKLLDLPTPPSKEELIELSYSLSLSLRELGRFALRKFYQIDAYDIYKKRVDDSRFLVADFAKKEDLELVLEGVIHADPQLAYLCIRAVCLIASRQLLNFELVAMLTRNRKIRNLLLEYLPGLLSKAEIRALKNPLENASKQGLTIYLMLTRSKSFWLFTNEAMKFLVEQECPVVFDQLRRHLIDLANCHKPLNDAELKVELLTHIERFSQSGRKEYKQMADQLGFALKFL